MPWYPGGPGSPGAVEVIRSLANFVASRCTHTEVRRGSKKMCSFLCPHFPPFISEGAYRPYIFLDAHAQGVGQNAGISSSTTYRERADQNRQFAKEVATDSQYPRKVGETWPAAARQQVWLLLCEDLVSNLGFLLPEHQNDDVRETRIFFIGTKERRAAARNMEHGHKAETNASVSAWN